MMWEQLNKVTPPANTPLEVKWHHRIFKAVRKVDGLSDKVICHDGRHENARVFTISLGTHFTDDSIYWRLDK